MQFTKKYDIVQKTFHKGGNISVKTTGKLEQEIRGAEDAGVLSGTGFEQPELSKYLRQLLDERHLTTGEVIQRCNLDRSYGYQLFNGTRCPTRDTLIILSFQLDLNEKQTQRLLKIAGRPALYARNRRDAAILFGLTHRLTLPQTEDLLSELEEEPLGFTI